MENTKFCQSCSMPLDDAAMRGTEKDGSASEDYCKYCYQNGAFTDPAMTIDDMRSIVKAEMEKRNIGTELIEKAVNVLPYLKGWQN